MDLAQLRALTDDELIRRHDAVDGLPRRAARAGGRAGDPGDDAPDPRLLAMIGILLVATLIAVTVVG